MTTMTEQTTPTLDAPGAVLTYDIRGADSDTTAPVLLLIGSPMGASGFGTLAGHFPDRTIVTYDPRGVERSTKADPSSPSTPEQHADDLHRIIAELGSRPGRHLREQRRRGERARPRGGAPGAGRGRSSPTSRRSPPSSPTARARWRPAEAVHDAYQQHGFGVGMARFILAVSHQGPMTLEFADQPDAGSGDVRAAGRGRRQPDRRAAAARTSSRAPTTSPTSMRCARRRPGSSSRAGVESEGQLANRGAERRRRAAGHRARRSSRATTAASSAASTARRAILTRFAAKLREVLAEA